MRAAVLVLLLLVPLPARAQPDENAARVAALIELLRHPAPSVRVEAASALGRLRAEAALRPLQVLAQTDLEPGVRAAAAVAVRRIHAPTFVAKLASSEPPPVTPRPPAPPPRRPAAILSAGAVLNALRAGDSAAAQVAAGLRWPLLDVQASLGFPALSLLLQLRVNVLASAWLVPYLTTGVAIAYNNGTGRGPTLSVTGGAGLRARVFWRLHLYAEVLANEVLLDSLPAGDFESRTFSLPIVLGATVEL